MVAKFSFSSICCGMPNLTIIQLIIIGVKSFGKNWVYTLERFKKMSVSFFLLIYLNCYKVR